MQMFQWLSQAPELRKPLYTAPRLAPVPAEQAEPRARPGQARAVPLPQLVAAVISVGGSRYETQLTGAQVNNLISLISRFTSSSWPSAEPRVTVDINSSRYRWRGSLPYSASRQVLRAAGVVAGVPEGLGASFGWLGQPITLEHGHQYLSRWFVDNPWSGSGQPPQGYPCNSSVLQPLFNVFTQPAWRIAQQSAGGVLPQLPAGAASMPAGFPSECPSTVLSEWQLPPTDPRSTVDPSALADLLRLSGLRLFDMWDVTPGQPARLVAESEPPPIRPGGGGFECPPGYTVDVPTQTCKKSTAAPPDCRQRPGTYVDRATNLCVPCDPGTVPNAYATACVPAPSSPPATASARRGGGGAVLAVVGVAVLIGAAVLLGRG